MDADSHAKVQMRSKVRGLRAIEREVLQPSPSPTEQAIPPETVAAAAVVGAMVQTVDVAAEPVPPLAAIVLDYCTAVRGILNDDQGGRCSLPASAWPRLWVNVNPCSAIWRLKKGAR